jgi:hypothetical protein
MHHNATVSIDLAFYRQGGSSPGLLGTKKEGVPLSYSAHTNSQLTASELNGASMQLERGIIFQQVMMG